MDRKNRRAFFFFQNASAYRLTLLVLAIPLFGQVLAQEPYTTFQFGSLGTHGGNITKAVDAVITERFLLAKVGSALEFISVVRIRGLRGIFASGAARGGRIFEAISNRRATRLGVRRPEERDSGLPGWIPNRVAVAGAADTPIGVITDEAAAIGDYVNVALLGARPSTVRMVAGGAISQGALLEPAASGRVQTLGAGAGTHHVVGRALDAATNAGDVIEVDPLYFLRVI